jgi:hypothetical protein
LLDNNILDRNAWRLWSDGAPVPVGAGEGRATGAADVAAGAVAGAAASDADTAPPTGEQRTGVAAGGATPLPFPPDAQWLDVLVVDATTGAPVPGAWVSWVNDAQWERIGTLLRAERRRYERDEQLVFDEFAWQTHSDGDGVARVSLHARWMAVQAREGTRYGSLTFHSEQRTTDPDEVPRIELHEDVTLRVRVLTANGDPAAGAPVDFWRFDPQQAQDNNLPAERVATAADGLAVFRHAQHVVEWQSKSRRGRPSVGWRIGLAVPGAEVSVAIDPRDPPPEPIEFRLPVTGGLRLRLLAMGRPAGFVAIARLIVNDIGDLSVWRCDVGDDGVVDFPTLPLGRAFLVGGNEWGTEVNGPTVAGEVVEHTIELTSLAFVVSGRLIGADGKALGESYADFEATVDVGGNVGKEAQRAAVAADGTFHWVPRRREPDATMSVQQLTVRVDSGERAVHAAIPPFTVGARGFELGDVQLYRGRRIVAGRVTSERGDLSELFLGIDRLVDGDWHREDIDVDVADDGSFAAHGRVDPGPLRLVVHGYTHLPVAPIAFAAGATTVEVLLRAGHRLTVRCALPPAMTGGALHWDLVQSGGVAGEAIEWGRTGRYDVAGEAQLVWLAIEAGDYTLIVRHPVTQGEVLRVPITVPAPDGAETRIELDLRDLVPTQTIEVLVHKHSDTFGCLAFPLPQADEPWRCFGLHEGTNVIARSHGAPDLLVAALGCRPVLLRDVGDAATAVLEPFTLAKLDVLAPLDTIGDLELTFVAEPLEPHPDAERRYANYSLERKLGQLLAPTPFPRSPVSGRVHIPLGDGPHRLRARVSNGEGREIELTGFTPTTLPGGGSYQVSIPDAELERAAAQLRRR